MGMTKMLLVKDYKKDQSYRVCIKASREAIPANQTRRSASYSKSTNNLLENKEEKVCWYCPTQKT